MKKLLAFFCAVVLLLSLASPAYAAELSMQADGRYKILLIADPQDDEEPAADTANLIRVAIEETQPDLIVCLGDMVEDSDVMREKKRGRTGC